MNKSELMNAIRVYQFYAVDLNLYLDNFPDNKCASDDYRIISSKLNAYMDEYEKNYGPLRNLGMATTSNPMAYVNEPWPWERERKGD